MTNSAQKPNKLLRYHREKRGWSQRKVAEQLNTTEDKISRWERGERKPSPFYREQLCTLFKVNAEELGFIQAEEKEPEQLTVIEDIDDMNSSKRDALKKIGMVVGTAFTMPSTSLLQSQSPLWERLSRTLERSSTIDETSITGLGQITKNYWQLRTSIGYRSLAKAFTGHLETIQQLLQIPQPQTMYRQLCILASEVSQYIGAIYFDMNDYVTANAYYKVSIQAAQEGECYILCAIGLGRMSSLPIYKDNHKDALPLLREAQKIANKQFSGTVLAWLLAVEAEALANLQEEKACLQALDQAEEALKIVGFDDNINKVKFDYYSLVGYKGVCHLRLQQPKDALIVLNQANSLANSLSPRQRSIIIVDTAEAYLQQQEIEKACEYATQALEMAERTQSNLTIQRLQKIRQKMYAWNSLTPVRDFDEQIALKTLLI